MMRLCLIVKLAMFGGSVGCAKGPSAFCLAEASYFLVASLGHMHIMQNDLAEAQYGFGHQHNTDFHYPEKREEYKEPSSGDIHV